MDIKNPEGWIFSCLIFALKIIFKNACGACIIIVIICSVNIWLQSVQVNANMVTVHWSQLKTCREMSATPMIIPPISQLQSHHSLATGAGPIGHLPDPQSRLTRPWWDLTLAQLPLQLRSKGAFKAYLLVSLSFIFPLNWTNNPKHRVWEAEELLPNLTDLSLWTLGKPINLRNTGVLGRD